MNKRVHQIAKEQGLTAKELLARLREAGHEVKAASSNVDEDLALKVLSDGSNGAAAPAAPAPAQEAPAAQAPVAAPKEAPASQPAAQAEAPPAPADPPSQAEPQREGARPEHKQR